MKLLIKQRFFSWFDSYNVYKVPDNTELYNIDLDRAEVAYTVEGQLAWGHEFHVLSPGGELMAVVTQELFTFLPRYNIEIGGNQVGTVSREFTLFTPSYSLDMRGWQIDGDFFGWDYEIKDERGAKVADISKELFNFTDTYMISVPDDHDALHALLVVLAIDAANCGK